MSKNSGITSLETQKQKILVTQSFHLRVIFFHFPCVFVQHDVEAQSEWDDEKWVPGQDSSEGIHHSVKDQLWSIQLKLDLADTDLVENFDLIDN